MKPSNLQIVSLPHTGTLFTRSLLGECPTIHVMALRKEPWKKGPTVRYVVPYRHPYRVWESWVRRRTTLGLDLTGSQQLLNEFLDQYSEQVTILPVDLPGIREDILKYELGRIAPGWEADRVYHTHRLPTKDDIRLLGRYIEVLHPRIGEFYGY